MISGSVRDLVELPSLPTGWTYTALEELLEKRSLSYGIVQPGSHSPDGVPIVRVNNLRDGRIIENDVLRVSRDIESKYARTRLRGGELLLSLVGSVGEVAIVPDRLAGWNVARAVAVVRPVDSISVRWLEYCLRSPLVQRYMRMWQTTTVQATLNLRDLRRLPVVMPPMQERDGIVELLGALDDKIDVNRRIAALLENVFRTSFRLWMGTRDDSWRVGQLGEVAARIIEAASPADVDPSTPYIGLEHMPRGSITLWNQGVVSDVASAKLAFRRGDILFGKLRAYFKKVVAVATDGLCSSDILVVRPASGWFSFSLGHLASDELIEYADQRSGGTRMPRATWTDIARYPVWLPSVPAAETLEAALRPMVTLTQHLVLESRVLAELRDLLLPRLICGDILLSGAAFEVQSPA